MKWGDSNAREWSPKWTAFWYLIIAVALLLPFVVPAQPAGATVAHNDTLYVYVWSRGTSIEVSCGGTTTAPTYYNQLYPSWPSSYSMKVTCSMPSSDPCWNCTAYKFQYVPGGQLFDGDTMYVYWMGACCYQPRMTWTWWRPYWDASIYQP